ncbi:helix-turn-helix transcriptional regulator [Sphingomonas mali]|uniref:helix-turn-helix transcriptional regulator n=1 Tax=Sphingomonas mali TaxID=40682 RepID=UPI00082C9D58|nr:AAA family ATPase [Sphingomonas mali]
MLLERDSILDSLDRLAVDAIAGHGRVVFVVGEAGIGKTSVLRAAAARMDGRLRLMWAVCEDWSTAEALTILRDLPVIDTAALDNAHDGSTRFALFGDTLARLSEEPTALLIEDLHWADDGSIDLIRYLGRRIADRPLLIVISSRNEDQGARGRLSRAAGDLPAGVRRRVDLARLSSAAVGKLAAAKGLIGSAIHDATDGNPLLVTEILANKGSRSTSIDDLVLARADLLDPPARAFLDFCSIVPRRVSLAQIEAQGATDRDIAACVDAGLLLADGEGLAFRHEITRHAVAAALSPLARKQLHARELARLDQAGASAARRLHHAVGAGEMAAIRALAPEAARTAAALGAHHEAVAAWDALLSRDEQPLDPAHGQAFAHELHVTGDLASAVEWQRRVLAIYEADGDRLRQGDALRFLSRLHYLNGDRALADQTGEAAVAALEPYSHTPELALAYANLAQLAMLADDPDETLRWSERAIPIARALGRDDILATVLNNYGTGMQYDDLERAMALLDESIALGAATGSQEHVARAFTNKSWLLRQARRLDAALAVAAEGVAYCRERDLDTWRDYMIGGQALTLLDLGRWDEARATAEPVVSSTTNTYLMRNPAVRAMAMLNIRCGDADPSELIAELHEHMARGREAPRFSSLALIVAEHAWTCALPPDEPLALLAEAAALIHRNGSPWDRAQIWYWRRKLGDDTAAPPNLPSPYAQLGQGKVAAAAAAFADQAMPFGQAQALIEGDDAQAMDGLAILDRLGASAWATRARSDLATRGMRKGVRGPRASTRRNSFGLTRREIDVLGAIDKGWTNRQIGEQLFVSAKTIDHHVSSILGKLGARTRGEAAALAREAGLLD